MRLNRLTIREIISNIENRLHFEALAPNGEFIVKVSRYVPYCCTAIHNGDALRKELKPKIALSDYERWYEEDPMTAEFIASMPITIIGLDSRFEYDLNRSPETCIYEEAWGKKVWKKNLTATDIKLSKKKHANYYKVLHTLVAKLEDLFGGCLVYDIHSYNYKRWDRKVPLFNIGTENIDVNRYREFIEHWLNELSLIKLTDIENITAENDVFFGRGYNLEYLTKNFKNTLVLATEIKKIFCDELSSDIYPKIVRSLQQKLKKAILNNANFFGSKLEKWHHVSIQKLLGKELDDNILKVDKALYNLVGNFELLTTVNPINTRKVKRKFFKSNYNELPKFKYNPVKINPFSLKQKLLSIPVNQIKDISVRSLYEAVITSYFDKIDMIGSLNTSKFLYNSLRYFGRPSKTDLTNASYILHLPDIPGEAKKEPTYDAKKAIEYFKEALASYKIEANIELSNQVISQVMVLNSQKKILVQPDARFKKKKLNALIEHEIGVHMATTMNSFNQKLKIFNIGLPVNTRTQEGLAILAEYLSGNITLDRLKKIALRVIIVDLMARGADFIECFNELLNEYNVEENEAFNVVTRVFRGGGFTKDYLYLSGFVKVFRFWEDHHDLTPLLVGKTSLAYLSTIEEMIGREMIDPPKYITKSLLAPKTERNDSIYNYIFSGLKY
jgi:uncharacterized protein (TIGR02421 family)